MINNIERPEYERWIATTYVSCIPTGEMIHELQRRLLCQQKEKLTWIEVNKLMDLLESYKKFLEK